VLVVHNAGGALACAINAMCAALMHAAVPMNDIVSAITAAVVDTIPVLDLNMNERFKAGMQLTLAANALSRDIVTMQSEQRINTDNLDTTIKIAQQGCSVVAKIIKQHVRDHLAKQVSS
jgi:ribonuclease PH